MQRLDILFTLPKEKDVLDMVQLLEEKCIGNILNWNSWKFCSEVIHVAVRLGGRAMLI